METLQNAIKHNQTLVFREGAVCSTKPLLPVQRNDGNLAFRISSNTNNVGDRKRQQMQLGHLRVLKTGRVDIDGSRNGPWASFVATSAPDGAIFLSSCATGLWVTIENGHFVSSEQPVALIPELRGDDPRQAAPPVSNVPVDTSVLSRADIAQFMEQGYLILRNGVPPELTKEALRAINHAMGQPSFWEHDNGQCKLSDSSCGKIGCEVFNASPRFWSAVNILLGQGNVRPWRNGQQVALRFPQPPARGDDIPDVKPGTRYHIDGMGENKLCPFSLLCGVALSDQSKPNGGNLHVFPGSHLHPELQQYYQERINHSDQGEDDQSKPDLGESIQVLLRPGDVVLAHQLLAHRVGVNTSENIRYQLYYRVTHAQHAALKEHILQNPWVEFGACSSNDLQPAM